MWTWHNVHIHIEFLRISGCVQNSDVWCERSEQTRTPRGGRSLEKITKLSVTSGSFSFPRMWFHVARACHVLLSAGCISPAFSPRSFLLVSPMSLQRLSPARIFVFGVKITDADEDNDDDRLWSRHKRIQQLATVTGKHRFGVSCGRSGLRCVKEFSPVNVSRFLFPQQVSVFQCWLRWFGWVMRCWIARLSETVNFRIAHCDMFDRRSLSLSDAWAMSSWTADTYANSYLRGRKHR